METLNGTIERITFHNPDNGFCVLKVIVKGHTELITIVGSAHSVATGELFESQGKWIQHREFGLQFQADHIKTVPPNTLEGIEKYLGSGMIKGIGPYTAKRLVEAFKHDVFDVIENKADQLRNIHGIGPARIAMITKAWQEQKIIRDIMIFLQAHGVSAARAARIYKTYGDRAIAKVRENPYQLARDIQGIGFKSADQIAAHLGISKTSIIRARAGLHHALFEKTGDGHCAYPASKLLEEAVSLLEIETSILQEALELEIKEKYLVQDDIDGTPCIYPVSLHRCETETAKMIHRLKNSPIPWKPIDFDDAILKTEKEMGIQLDPLQQKAISQALISKLMIITGGPGTGKTTITRSIISILKSHDIRIALCSPTGRAAKRLSECTHMEAKTIHRLLGYDPISSHFKYHKDNPLPIDFLLMDEASMVDLPLMYSLLKAVPPNAAVIIVGDEDQLPSVGPGTILKALIESGEVPTVKLTQIFRQSAHSHIIQAAHRVRLGQMPDLVRKDKTADFHFIGIDEPEIVLSKIIELVSHRIPQAYGFNPVRDIQVLCPMHRGILGSRNVNMELQKILNPNPSGKVERFGISYSPNDKIMVIANDYDKEVFNGDIGTIRSIDAEEQTVLIDFDGRDILFDFSDLDLITLAYSISIHKSQGSEYPAVIIPLTMQHYTLLKRNLIYTGLTRGKKLVILIGQKKALAIALRDVSQEPRWNHLAHRIKATPETP